MNEENARLRDEIDKVLRERDEAQRARDQYLRERDLALRAEERARESLEELEEAIDECLPGDDDDAPLDCVEHAADRLRDLAKERDEARAEVERLRAEVASSLAMASAEADVLRGFGCMEDGDGPCGVCRECFYRHGYRRGAEAMREACAAALMADGLVLSRERAAKVVRALPIPEEP